MNAEQSRLEQARNTATPWKKWGTVRKDYSENCNAWDYFNHEKSHSHAYHCGEDGLAGILVRTNQGRGRQEAEYELLDTGVYHRRAGSGIGQGRRRD